MTSDEAEAVQHLVSAAIRVVRAPAGNVVEFDSPMARAIFNLALQLASMGLSAKPRQLMPAT